VLIPENTWVLTRMQVEDIQDAIHRMQLPEDRYLHPVYYGCQSLRENVCIEREGIHPPRLFPGSSLQREKRTEVLTLIGTSRTIAMQHCFASL